MVQDLYILIITAAVVSILFKLLKQPVVLGYIVAGVLVGPYLFGKTPEEPHQQRQGCSNRCADHHRRYDDFWLPRGMGC